MVVVSIEQDIAQLFAPCFLFSSAVLLDQEPPVRQTIRGSNRYHHIWNLLDGSSTHLYTEIVTVIWLAGRVGGTASSLWAAASNFALQIPKPVVDLEVSRGRGCSDSRLWKSRNLSKPASRARPAKQPPLARHRVTAVVRWNRVDRWPGPNHASVSHQPITGEREREEKYWYKYTSSVISGPLFNSIQMKKFT